MDSAPVNNENFFKELPKVEVRELCLYSTNTYAMPSFMLTSVEASAGNVCMRFGRGECQKTLTLISRIH
jgi:hypothetical protein